MNSTELLSLLIPSIWNIKREALCHPLQVTVRESHVESAHACQKERLTPYFMVRSTLNGAAAGSYVMLMYHSKREILRESDFRFSSMWLMNTGFGHLPGLR